MHKDKAKSIVALTEEIHLDVTDIYESLMDEDDLTASKQIDAVVAKLKHLKSNLIIRDK